MQAPCLHLGRCGFEAAPTFESWCRGSAVIAMGSPAPHQLASYSCVNMDTLLNVTFDTCPCAHRGSTCTLQQPETYWNAEPNAVCTRLGAPHLGAERLCPDARAGSASCANQHFIGGQLRLGEAGLRASSTAGCMISIVCSTHRWR
jgi:hypothetical protein